jgi:Ca2+:H+ antiporter
LVIPAAYHSVKAGENSDKHGFSLSLFGKPELDPIYQKGLLQISRGTAVLLLGVYLAYLWFQVRSSMKHLLFLLHVAPAVEVA